jgi:hypothetical protein
MTVLKYTHLEPSRPTECKDEKWHFWPNLAGAPINNKYTTYNNNLPSSPKSIVYFRNEGQVLDLDSSNWLSLVGLNEDVLLCGLCAKKILSVFHQPAYLLGYAYGLRALVRHRCDKIWSHRFQPSVPVEEFFVPKPF